MNLIGKTIGHYQIIEKLGQGGFADVYLAKDTNLERDVALKILRTETFPPIDLERIVQRFRKEIQVLADLEHPNIIHILYHGDHDGKPYLVMPYISGGTLKNLLKKPIAWQEAFKIFLPVLEAVAYAHEKKIIHRDIKPSNILLRFNKAEKLSPLLTDFGLAKILDDTELSLSFSSEAIGSLNYMSPEQKRGKATFSSDQYSLGVILFQMITGHLPMDDFDNPHDPKYYFPSIDPKVEAVIIKMIKNDPSERYSTINEVISEFETLLNDDRTVTISPTPKTVPPKKKNTLPLIGLTIATLIIGAIIIPKILSAQPSSTVTENTLTVEPAIAVIENTQLPTDTNEPKVETQPIITPTTLPSITEAATDKPEPTLTKIPPTATNTQEILAFEPPNITYINQTTRSIKMDTSWINDIKYSHNGKLVAIACNTGIWIYRSSDLRPYTFIDTEQIVSIDFSPDDKNLAAGGAIYTDKIEVWDTETGALLRTIETSAKAGVSFSPDGTKIISSDEWKTKLWDAENGQLIRTIKENNSSINVAAFSTDGSEIATAFRNKVIKIWKTDNGELVRSLAVSEYDVDNLAFSPDGKFIAGSSWAGRLYVWDANTGGLLITINNGDRINSLAFSPDSRSIATGSEDNTVKLWAVNNGKLLQSITEHENWVRTVAISPDGNTIASGALDHTVMFSPIEK